MTYSFRVLGSDGLTEYVVSVKKQNGRILATCTCSAGIFGKLCKHKISMLSGQEDLLVLPNDETRKLLGELILEVRDTECANHLAEIHLVTAELEKQKKRLDRAKKSLEKSLNPNS